MNTVKDEWDAFSDQVIPKTAPEVQHREMKRAFYAGAASILSIQLNIGDEIDNNAGAAILKGLYEELLLFVKRAESGLE